MTGLRMHLYTIVSTMQIHCMTALYPPLWRLKCHLVSVVAHWHWRNTGTGP